jgi:hypothetical protein
VLHSPSVAPGTTGGLRERHCRHHPPISSHPTSTCPGG